jgi:hypothetical protein
MAMRNKAVPILIRKGLVRLHEMWQGKEKEQKEIIEDRWQRVPKDEQSHLSSID